MRVLVVGCGSIGRRHIGNLRSLGVGPIASHDPAAERARAAVADYGTEDVSNLDTALQRGEFDLTLVCTPPSTHVEIASKAVAGGSHLFVEKPLANNLVGVDKLIADATRASRVLAVGYNLRFHRGVRTLKASVDRGDVGKPLIIRADFGQYLPDWRPAADYRTGYNVSAALGGGIILDASHELDYVRWIGGEIASVSCAASHLSTLYGDTEDTAAITMKMQSDCIAEVHLDCIQRAYSRSCKVIGEEGTLVWEYGDGLRRFAASRRAWEHEPMSIDANEMYVEEMKHLLACVNGTEEPLVSGADGKRVLEIALAAKESSRQRCEVQL